MASPQEPLLAGIQDESARLKSDVADFLRVRWRLAWLEVQTAARSACRLAVVLAVAVLLVLSSLPVLAVALAKTWEGWLSVSFAGWLAIFGFGTLALAGMLALFSYLRFRSEFVGLEQTLEELREDVAWLEERFSRDKDEA